jgi:uncharacterized membrane protein
MKKIAVIFCESYSTKSQWQIHSKFKQEFCYVAIIYLWVQIYVCSKYSNKIIHENTHTSRTYNILVEPLDFVLDIRTV